MRTHLQDALFPNVQLQEVKLKLVKGAESKSATDLPRTRRPPPQCAAPRGQAKAGQRRRDEICYRSSSHKLQEVRLKLVNGAESNLLQIFLAQGMSHGHRDLWLITGYTRMNNMCKRIPDT